MMSNTRTRSLVVLAALAVAATAAITAPRAARSQAALSSPQPSAYSVTDLGSVPGFNRYFGNGINRSGQAAVGSAQDSTPGHALFYNGAVLKDLGTLKSAAYSTGFGINDLGWVVGESSRATLWKNGGPAIDLVKAGGRAVAINNAASPQITGTAWGSRRGGAFLWQNGAHQMLPFLEGYAINDLGQIAGRNNDNACFWSKATGLVNLPTLGGGPVTEAFGINNSGVVVGGSPGPDGEMHAVRWEGYAIQDLGLLLLPGIPPAPSRHWWTRAKAINSSGVIVGEAGGYGAAWRWDPGSQTMVDLNTLIDPLVYPGVSLSVANGINDVGQIVGYGSVSTDPGHEHAFILTPQ